jgi:hypothetical protein
MKYLDYERQKGGAPTSLGTGATKLFNGRELQFIALNKCGLHELSRKSAVKKKRMQNRAESERTKRLEEKRRATKPMRKLNEKETLQPKLTKMQRWNANERKKNEMLRLGAICGCKVIQRTPLADSYLTVDGHDLRYALPRSARL